MKDCIILKKRIKNVEKYLMQGPLEVDCLQSYYPIIGHLGKLPYSKWNTMELNKTLIDVIDYNKNIGIIYNKNCDSKEEIEFFTKCTPILDTIGLMQNKYMKNNLSNWLPTKKYIYETTSYKIQNPQNTAYVDSLCSVLLGKLNELNICPHFGSVYGIYNGIVEEFKENICEEFDLYKQEDWFNNGINKKRFNINIYKESNNLINTEFEELDLNNVGNNLSDDDLSIDSEGSACDVEVTHPKVPVQIVIMEKFSETFDDLIFVEWKELANQTVLSKNKLKKYINYIKKKIVMKKMTSWIFQICAGLTLANKEYSFVHNDLHIHNIMGMKTKEEFIYYKLDEQIYKVPTYGYVMKIIDFGRATFKYKKNHFFGDIFGSDGEAGGQYSYPYEDDVSEISSTSSEFDEYIHYDKENNCNIEPNLCFDLSRFACSILEDINEEFSDLKSYKLGQLLYEWSKDDSGRSLLELNGFALYKHIARFVSHTIPRKQLKKDIFDIYKIKNENLIQYNNLYCL